MANHFAASECVYLAHSYAYRAQISPRITEAAFLMQMSNLSLAQAVRRPLIIPARFSCVEAMSRELTT